MKIHIFQVNLAVALLVCCNLSLAAVHVTLQGSQRNNDVGLQSYHKNSVTASVAFDIGSHFRLGLTHGEENTTIGGYALNSLDQKYYAKTQKIFTTSNSLDLIYIIYYGRVFIPYMQAGLVIKDYFVVDTIAGMSSSASVQSSPVPKAGIGINIVLNRSFSLKVSYDISSGSKIKDPYNREKVETVWDDNTSVGLTYKI